MHDRASSTPSATTTTQALPIDALVPETWNASPPDSLPTAQTPGPVLTNDSDQVSQRAADIEQIITQTTLVPKKITTTTTTTVQSVENTPFVQQPAGLSQQNGGQNAFVPEISIKTRPSDNTLVSDAQPALIQSEQDFNQQTPIVAQMKAPATSVPTIIPPTVLPKNVFIPEVQPNIWTKPQGRGRRLRVRQWDD
ncbi:hypothetical protein DPMN_106359 [Dreissena polymorpha]|uniref:Uncharacterized protein n=1 Tax=Dreissena polymorpha TaxID=45954 RepID=A0A9D4K4U6_DREPO|nr:hypothetical protein DPMN_106359 [Dreissena polymorpha]